jgi:antirestriction protein
MERDQQDQGGGTNDEAAQGGAEREPQLVPRIYAASLSDYNAGRLHGAWLDATGDADELAAGVQAMLASSPTPGAEEWAIHDYEGFGPARLDEYESLETVTALGRGIAEHGPAFAHWAALVGTGESDEPEHFEDAYLGHFDSLEAYAEELFDDLGYTQLIDDVIPEHLQAYVRLDVEAFARDLELSGDVTSSEGDGGVYVFDQIR